MFRSFPISVAALALTINVHAQQPINCRDYVVFDKINVNSSQQLYHRLYDILSRSTSNTHDGASQAAANAGIPVPLLDNVFKLDVSASGQTKDFATFREDFLHQTEDVWMSRLNQAGSYQIYSALASKNVDKCFDTIADGLSGYFTPTAQYQGFFFTFRYRQHSTEKNERVNWVKVSPEKVVSECNPRDPLNLGTFHSVDPHGMPSFHCLWTDPNKDILVTVSTPAESKSFTMAGIAPSTPPSGPDIYHQLKDGAHAVVVFDKDANVPGMLLALGGPGYTIWYNSGSRVWHSLPGPRANGSTTPEMDSTNIPDWDPVEKHQFVLFNANFGFQPNGRVDRGGWITVLKDKDHK